MVSFNFSYSICIVMKKLKMSCNIIRYIAIYNLNQWMNHSY